MSRLSLYLLGPFQAVLEGRPVVGFRSDKARALLVYLAVEADRPHSREPQAQCPARHGTHSGVEPRFELREEFFT